MLHKKHAWNARKQLRATFGAADGRTLTRRARVTRESTTVDLIVFHANTHNLPMAELKARYEICTHYYANTLNRVPISPEFPRSIQRFTLQDKITRPAFGWEEERRGWPFLSWRHDRERIQSKSRRLYPIDSNSSGRTSAEVVEVAS